MNKQPITKQDLNRNGLVAPYIIKEIFYTLQGEGPFSGLPAIFIRMSGCNLACTWCDTDYTGGQEYYLAQLVDKIKAVADEHNTKLIVLTGGEPFRQNIVPLIDKLFTYYIVQIETNGTLWLERFDFGKATVVCSPKTSRVHKRFETALAHVHWKYIVSAKNVVGSDDGLPMFSTQQPHKANKLFRPANARLDKIWVSPLDEKNPVVNKLNEDTAVTSCLKHGWRLSLQIHKLVGLP